MELEQEIEDLRKAYAKEIPERVSRIQREMEKVITTLGQQGKAEWQDFERETHRFAGASGTYGFTVLCDLAKFVEEAIDRGALQTLKPHDAAGFLNRWYGILASVARKVATGESDVNNPIPLQEVEKLYRQAGGQDEGNAA